MPLTLPPDLLKKRRRRYIPEDVDEYDVGIDSEDEDIGDEEGPEETELIEYDEEDEGEGLEYAEGKSSPLPIKSTEYVGFNWLTYGVSAAGTFLILWWGLK